MGSWTHLWKHLCCLNSSGCFSLVVGISTWTSKRHISLHESKTDPWFSIFPAPSPPLLHFLSSSCPRQILGIILDFFFFFFSHMRHPIHQQVHLALHPQPDSFSPPPLLPSRASHHLHLPNQLHHLPNGLPASTLCLYNYSPQSSQSDF